LRSGEDPAAEQPVQAVGLDRVAALTPE